MGVALISTDPTYKEWKPIPWDIEYPLGQTARILPTRNGNREVFGSEAKRPRPRTDPTYKEWKPLATSLKVARKRQWHGSYLQGMETG